MIVAHNSNGISSGSVVWLLQDDVESCRSHLLTVAGVISITFDMKKHQAILRTRADLQPQVCTLQIYCLHTVMRCSVMLRVCLIDCVIRYV